MRSLLGLAPALIQNGFAAVVAMQYKILDMAALVFARAFYRALTIGQTAGLVDAAVTEARGRLEVELQGHRSFATPVLFIHAPDGRIFELPAVPARADTVPSDLGDEDRDATLEPAVAVQPHRVPVEFDWVTIPAGEFPMGSDPDMGKRAPENERPQHPVYLAEFRIARVPVTNAQYRAFVDAAGQTPPQHWGQGAVPPGKEEHPVVFVSWHDAQAFCQWARVRLPTEAEWEKAARGTDGRLWPWGNEPPHENRCNFNKDGDEAGTTPVDKYPQGASPYGVLDMAGNVWEWVSSLYQDYGYRPDDGRENPDAQGGRVLRGGSFRSDHDHVRCANRASLAPTTREEIIGFRVVSLTASS
jgi:serine/threonine-protein kinase